MNIASDPLAVRAALVKIERNLISLGITNDSCFTVQLVLAEALNNIVEHAYRDIPGSIDLTLQFRAHQLKCVLSDFGHAMPLLELPQGRAAQDGTDLSDLPEGGFGWLLIRQFTKDLFYQRQDGRNHLSFAIATQTARPARPARNN